MAELFSAEWMNQLKDAWNEEPEVRDKLAALVEEIEAAGGRISARSLDARDPDAVTKDTDYVFITFVLIFLLYPVGKSWVRYPLDLFVGMVVSSAAVVTAAAGAAGCVGLTAEGVDPPRKGVEVQILSSALVLCHAQKLG